MLAQAEGILKRLEVLYDDELRAVAAKDVDALAALSSRRRQGAADAATLATLAARIGSLGAAADGPQAAFVGEFVRACEAVRARAQESKARTARLSRSVCEGLKSLACVRTLCAGGRPARRGTMLDREG